MYKFSELKTKDRLQLENEIISLREKMLFMKLSSNPNMRIVKDLRKSIAQVKTALNQL